MRAQAQEETLACTSFTRRLIDTALQHGMLLLRRRRGHGINRIFQPNREWAPPPDETSENRKVRSGLCMINKTHCEQFFPTTSCLLHQALAKFVFGSRVFAKLKQKKNRSELCNWKLGNWYAGQAQVGPFAQTRKQPAAENLFYFFIHSLNFSFLFLPWVFVSSFSEKSWTLNEAVSRMWKKIRCQDFRGQFYYPCSAQTFPKVSVLSYEPSKIYSHYPTFWIISNKTGPFVSRQVSNEWKVKLVRVWQTQAMNVQVIRELLLSVCNYVGNGFGKSKQGS